jgi:hypothetical protein
MSAELRRVYHNLYLYLLFLILAFALAVAYVVTYVVPLVPVNYYRITAAAAARCELVEEVLSTSIDEVDQTGYVLKVTARCRGNSQGACRSEILREMLRELPRGAGN